MKKPKSPVTQPVFISGNLCGDFASQRTGFLNLILYAWLYDWIMVIPKDVGHFYDIPYFEMKFNHLGVKFIHEDDHLKSNNKVSVLLDLGEKSLTRIVKPQDMQLFLKDLSTIGGIVKFGCMHRHDSISWNTTDILSLRSFLENSLIPNNKISEYVKMSLKKMNNKYITIHNGMEPYWADHCRHIANIIESLEIGETAYKHCYLSPQQIVTFVQSNGIDLTQSIYIVGENYSEFKRAFLESDYKYIYTRQDFSPSPTTTIEFNNNQKEYIDFQISTFSSLFIANAYSLYNYEIKLIRQFSMAPTWYYNLKQHNSISSNQFEMSYWNVNTNMNIPLTHQLYLKHQPPYMGEAVVQYEPNSRYLYINGTVLQMYENKWKIESIEVSSGGGKTLIHIPIRSLECRETNVKCNFEFQFPTRFFQKSSIIKIIVHLSNGGQIDFPQPLSIHTPYTSKTNNNNNNNNGIIYIYPLSNTKTKHIQMTPSEFYKKLKKIGFVTKYYNNAIQLNSNDLVIFVGQDISNKIAIINHIRLTNTRMAIISKSEWSRHTDNEQFIIPIFTSGQILNNYINYINSKIDTSSALYINNENEIVASRKSKLPSIINSYEPENDIVSSYGLLFRTVAITASDKNAVITMLISIFIHYPLAQVEILTDSEESFTTEYASILRYLYRLGYTDSIHIRTLNRTFQKLNLLAAVLIPFISSGSQSNLLIVLPPTSVIIKNGLALLTHQLITSDKEMITSDGVFIAKIDSLYTELYNRRKGLLLEFIKKTVQKKITTSTYTSYDIMTLFTKKFMNFLYKETPVLVDHVNINIDGLISLYIIISNSNDKISDSKPMKIKYTSNQCNHLQYTMNNVLWKSAQKHFNLTQPSYCADHTTSNNNIMSKASNSNNDMNKGLLPIAGFLHVTPTLKRDKWRDVVTELMITLYNDNSTLGYYNHPLGMITKQLFVGFENEDLYKRKRVVQDITNIINKISPFTTTSTSSSPSSTTISSLPNSIKQSKSFVLNVTVLDYIDKDLHMANSLISMQKFCQNPANDNYLVYFIYNKGITMFRNLYSKEHNLRKYMSKFIIGRYHYACVNALQNHRFDVCGVEFTKPGITLQGIKYPAHFYGNFWWSSCKHIKTLKGISNGDKQLSEYWVTSKFGTKIRNLWHTDSPLPNEISSDLGVYGFDKFRDIFSL